MKFYVDSNVFLNYLLDEFSGIEYSAAYAKQLFKDTLSCKHNLVIAELVVDEVCKIAKISRAEFMQIFRRACSLEKLIVVEVCYDMMHKAEQIRQRYGVPFKDSAHIAIAVAEGCDAVVTNDLKHFCRAESPIKILSPSQIS